MTDTKRLKELEDLVVRFFLTHPDNRPIRGSYVRSDTNCCFVMAVYCIKADCPVERCPEPDEVLDNLASKLKIKRPFLEEIISGWDDSPRDSNPEYAPFYDCGARAWKRVDAELERRRVKKTAEKVTKE